MDNSQLLAVIRSHRDNSLGVEDGDLSNERAAALDHYHGRPYGDEKEGRSAIVSKDLHETVDWIMPAIMRVFLQSGKLAEFPPVGPEDEEQAEQASDYVHHILTQDNNAFIYLHDSAKDALLLKNGYLKHWWEVTEKTSEEQYSGLTEDELAAVLAELEQHAEVTIKEQEERTEVINGQFLPIYDVKLQITRKHGRIRIEAIPVEEVRVSKQCRGPIAEAPFVEHVTTRRRYQLLEDGMPPKFVDELPAVDQDDNDQMVLARDSTVDESDESNGTSTDRSMDEIAYTEAYLRVDYDDDGIAELRKVVTAGDRIPPGSDWNEVIDTIPMTDTTAKRMPHRHIGESLDDDLADLQRVMTVLKRQMLDNLYLTNNAELVINDRANLPDFLQSLPGGLKRVAGEDPVNGSVMQLPVQPVVGQILPVLDYMSTVKENRTGITKASTGLDPDVLKQATKGAFMENLNRASQKVEMIIRTLAETGVKQLALRVYELAVKHQDKPRMIKLRGKWVPMNPADWHERMDVSVRVGLGTGTEEEKREKLLLVAGLQEKLAQAGLVGPQQAYALFGDIAKTLGFDMPEKYAMDPNSPEFQQAMQQQQPPPNPLAEAEQIKGQFKLQADQMRLQFDAQVQQLKQQMEQQKTLMELQAKYASDAADRASREAIAAYQGEVKALIEGLKVDAGKPGIGAGLQEGQ